MEGNLEVHKGNIYFPIVEKIAVKVSKSKNKSYAVREKKLRQ